MVKRVWVATKRFALIDDEDAERVAKFDWCISQCGSNTAYAKTHDRRLGAKWRLLHRYILDAPPDAVVDHINGNGLKGEPRSVTIAAGKDIAAAIGLAIVKLKG